jgi:hypothetical protein
MKEGASAKLHEMGATAGNGRASRKASICSALQLPGIEQEVFKAERHHPPTHGTGARSQQPWPAIWRLTEDWPKPPLAKTYVTAAISNGQPLARTGPVHHLYRMSCAKGRLQKRCDLVRKS